MDTPETELPRRTSWGRLAVGCLVAVGIALVAGSPAMADNWNNGHGNKHWKHHHKHHNYYSYNNYGYYRPQVVYVQPQPVYVQPAPVYVAPPPPVYYYEPYHRPSVSIVFPIEID